jgi:hypothetical protein
MVSTETGILVPGTCKDFDLLSQLNLLIKEAKSMHCEVPYSSEANKKEKLKLVFWAGNQIRYTLH